MTKLEEAISKLQKLSDPSMTKEILDKIADVGKSLNEVKGEQDLLTKELLETKSNYIKVVNEKIFGGKPTDDLGDVNQPKTLEEIVNEITSKGDKK